MRLEYNYKVICSKRIMRYTIILIPLISRLLILARLRSTVSSKYKYNIDLLHLFIVNCANPVINRSLSKPQGVETLPADRENYKFKGIQSPMKVKYRKPFSFLQFLNGTIKPVFTLHLK